MPNLSQIKRQRMMDFLARIKEEHGQGAPKEEPGAAALLTAAGFNDILRLYAGVLRKASGRSIAA